MLSQFERFGFLGKVRVYTFRDYFKNDVPSGLDVFKKLLQFHAQPNGAHVMEMGGKKLRIKDFKITNTDFAEILFQMTDPSIPDNVLVDRVKGGARIASRLPSEDPAVSAHCIVDLNSKFDIFKSYPTCIENIDYLPRSLVVHFMNQWMSKSLSEERIKKDSKGKDIKRRYTPRIEFIAPTSQTIASAFENGGVLRGVKWVEDKYKEATFGDAAYPVVKRSDVGITVKNRPTKDAAKALVKEIISDLKGSGTVKTMKITIEDGNERTKTIGLDPHQNNALSTLFIPQVLFDNFQKPMAMCENAIRSDLTAKMKKALVD